VLHLLPHQQVGLPGLQHVLLLCCRYQPCQQLLKNTLTWGMCSHSASTRFSAAARLDEV
jgi:hypothetical protein